MNTLTETLLDAPTPTNLNGNQIKVGDFIKPYSKWLKIVKIGAYTPEFFVRNDHALECIDDHPARSATLEDGSVMVLWDTNWTYSVLVA